MCVWFTVVWGPDLKAGAMCCSIFTHSIVHLKPHFKTIIVILSLRVRNVQLNPMHAKHTECGTFVH